MDATLLIRREHMEEKFTLEVFWMRQNKAEVLPLASG
jgi:hypothetical protein